MDKMGNLLRVNYILRLNRISNDCTKKIVGLFAGLLRLSAYYDFRLYQILCVEVYMHANIFLNSYLRN